MENDINLLKKLKIDKETSNQIEEIEHFCKEENFDNFSPDIILLKVNQNNILNLPAEILFTGNYFEKLKKKIFVKIYILW